MNGRAARFMARKFVDDLLGLLTARDSVSITWIKAHAVSTFRTVPPPACSVLDAAVSQSASKSLLST